MQGHEETIHIDAPPERVYDVISDVTRTGEWSPVCHRVEWTGGSSGPESGATFKGWNKQGPMRWSRECRVREAERGKVFSFSTYVKDKESTRWQYTLEPANGGTELTETYEPVWAPGYVRVLGKLAEKRMARESRKNLRASLERIKRTVEQEAKAGS